jgi:hypothetical protein
MAFMSQTEFRKHVADVAERHGGQRQLALITDVKEAQISRFVNGQIGVSRRIMEAFGVRFDRAEGKYERFRDPVFREAGAADALEKARNDNSALRRDIRELRALLGRARIANGKALLEISAREADIEILHAKVEQLEGNTK